MTIITWGKSKSEVFENKSKATLCSRTGSGCFQLLDEALAEPPSSSTGEPGVPSPWEPAGKARPKPTQTSWVGSSVLNKPLGSSGAHWSVRTARSVQNWY